MNNPTDMNSTDYQYFNLLSYVLNDGIDKDDRTGIGTRSIFGHRMEFNLSEGFPILTTKKIHWKSVVHELLWMLKGDTNIDYLNRNGVTIWDEWADANGDLGPVYGAQWRRWKSDRLDMNGNPEYIDQIKEVLIDLVFNPDTRRMVVSAWNVSHILDMKLPPCHYSFQLYTHLDQGKRYLSCLVNIRSNDVFLGTPFNISQYALLTHILANMVDMIPCMLIYNIGDAHIYKNHIKQCVQQLARDPYELPTLNIKRKITLDMIDNYELTLDDFELKGYQYHPAIKAPIAV